MRTRFQIYYANGAIVEGNTAAEWTAAPTVGVLVVVEVYDAVYGPRHRRRSACRRWAGVDYYWMTPTDEIGAGNASEVPVSAVTKRGRLVDDVTWCRIYNQAQQDPLYVCLN